MTLQMVIAASLIALLTAVSSAQDWSSCQDDLDRVRRAARDASDTAQELESKARELEDKRFELQSCLSYRHDRCEFVREEYQRVREEYNSKKSDLESELSSLESRFRSVQSSCGYNFALGGGTIRRQPPQRQSGLCNVLQSYKGTTPPATLLSICLRSMPEEECRKCLQLNPPAQTAQPPQQPQVASKITERAGDKTFIALVQFDGPRVKYGITLDAQLVADGSGSGTGKVVYPGNAQLLNGKYRPLTPAGTSDLKILEKDILKKLKLREDIPSAIAVFSGGDTIMECVYGEVQATNQKTGSCKDNQGNRYRMVFE